MKPNAQLVIYQTKVSTTPSYDSASPAVWLSRVREADVGDTTVQWIRVEILELWSDRRTYSHSFIERRRASSKQVREPSLPPRRLFPSREGISEAARRS